MKQFCFQLEYEQSIEVISKFGIHNTNQYSFYEMYKGTI